MIVWLYNPGSRRRFMVAHAFRPRQQASVCGLIAAGRCFPLHASVNHPRCDMCVAELENKHPSAVRMERRAAARPRTQP